MAASTQPISITLKALSLGLLEKLIYEPRESERERAKIFRGALTWLMAAIFATTEPRDIWHVTKDLCSQMSARLYMHG